MRKFNVKKKKRLLHKSEAVFWMRQQMPLESGKKSILRKPAADKSGGLFFLTGKQTEIKLFPFCLGVEVKAAALSVRQRLDPERAREVFGQIESRGAVKVIDDKYRTRIRHGAEALRVRTVLEKVRKVAVLSPEEKVFLNLAAEPVGQKRGVVHGIALLPELGKDRGIGML